MEWDVDRVLRRFVKNPKGFAPRWLSMMFSSLGALSCSFRENYLERVESRRFHAMES